MNVLWELDYFIAPEELRCKLRNRSSNVPFAACLYVARSRQPYGERRPATAIFLR
jgi:hypothetical protein